MRALARIVRAGAAEESMQGLSRSGAAVRARAAGSVALVGLAALGVAAGHEATYRLLIPSAALRHEVLRDTGHGDWQLFALAPVLVAVLWAVAGAVGARCAPLAVQRGAGGTLRRLAALQAVAFVGLEVVERTLFAAPSGGLEHLLSLGVLLPVGVAVQAVVAAATGLLLSAAALVAAMVGRPRPIVLVPPAFRRLLSPRRIQPLVPLWAGGACGVRGPPLTRQ